LNPEKIAIPLRSFLNVYPQVLPLITSISALVAGFSLSVSLIMTIGPQNVHVLRMGLARKYLLTTVLACAVTDAILIAIGVLGFANLTAMSPLVYWVFALGAIAFLFWYGLQAVRRALRPASTALDIAGQALPSTAKSALVTALAFSWLNPHAWLDTTVLIGTASLAHQAPNNYAFGIGAALGSFAWFVGLGAIAARLADKLARPSTWRAIDCLVCLTMWATALWLALNLVKRF
jgi:L-lysine exporter family protein LysE/ArgO